MVSTPSDLTQFIEALFGGKLIASLEQMKTIKINTEWGFSSTVL
jgi:hypothetical protein